MDDVVKWCLDSHDGPSAVARVTILEDVAWTIFCDQFSDFSGMFPFVAECVTRSCLT